MDNHLWINIQERPISTLFRALVKLFTYCMINIEKLSALRSAGFPLKTVPDALSEIQIIIPIDRYQATFPQAVEIAGEWYLPPHIEDVLLILGQDFRKLSHEGLGTHPWIAVGGRDQLHLNEVDGETPLEAVVNLYLEIKKE